MQSLQSKNADPARIPVQDKKQDTIQTKINDQTENPFQHALDTPKNNPFIHALNPPLQTKLAIGQPNDAYEQEADRIAEQVVGTNQPVQRKCAACEQEEKIQPKTLASQITPLGASFTQRKCADCEAKEKLQGKFIQRKEDEATASNQIESQINSSKGGGNSLDANTQNFMGERFGTDFSGVRVHTNSESVQMNQQLGAKAFTVGNDIHFNRGEYNPGSQEGNKLLAHELVHTIQQDFRQGIFRTVVSTPVNRKNATEIFGTSASTGLTLEAFEQYTRNQADWFTDTSLTQTDRDELWSLLLKTTTSPSILAGVGDIRLSQLRVLNAVQWSDLEVFCRGCHSDTHTVRINRPSSYSTLQARIDLGTTLKALEQIIPPDVLELTVSEAQLRDIHSTSSLMGKIASYWQNFSPHLQQTFEVAPNARGPEFQQILDLLSTGTGITPFMPLQGRIRNLHRFTILTLTKLVQNFANTTRTKPVHLVILSGHDSSASFASDRPLLQTLVTTSPNLVLILEGVGTLASLTAEIPTIAANYGQPDATGTHRIAQVMISGHGSSHTVELTGTGAASVDHDRRIIDYQSVSLDTTQADTQTFVDTILQNLDPATARIVFNGCLVGSNPIPSSIADADIGTFINAHPNMKTFVESRAATLGLGLGAHAIQGARASLGSLTGLMDRAGNLEARSTDPSIFGDAATYAATGHEPEGVMTSAVEVASTNPVLAADRLRARQAQGIRASEGWWDQCTMVFVNVAMDGITAGNPVDLSKVRKLSHMVTPTFLARWDFGITVASFVSDLNSVDATLANAIYQQIDTTPMTVFRTPPDNDARKMRLLIEQARIALGHNRITELINTAALFTPTNTAVNTIRSNLDVTVLASQASSIFSQPISRGLIRLALAWLFIDATNTHMRNFLTAQVSSTSSGPSSAPVPTLSSAVRGQLGTRTERDILEALGLLTPVAPPSSAGAAASNFANAQGVGSTDNNLFIHPEPARRMAFLAINTTTPVLQQPSVGATQLGVLHPADEVNVTGTSGNFSAIDFNGQLGFVLSTDLF